MYIINFGHSLYNIHINWPNQELTRLFALYSDNQLVSASEDGTIRLWDMKQSSATSIIKPYENDRLARAELGKWMGTASISDDWLVSIGQLYRL